MMFIPLFLILSGSAVSADSASVTHEATNVLFVGNSYTSVNNLPQILEQVSVAAKLDRPIRCTMATKGGATLEMHWKNPAFRELLKSRKWDIVVLQEQSLRPIEKPELFHQYAQLWTKEIKSLGAKPVFYMTWARKASPEKQSDYSEAYRKAGKECEAAVAPVGEAWKAVREQKPGIELFAKDGSHPSYEGSYLAACVFYATITGKSPVGLPGSEDVPFLQQSAETAVLRQRH